MALPSFSPTQDESLSADGGYLSSLVKPNPAFLPQEQQFGAANLGADQGVLPSTQMATTTPQSLPSQPLAQGALQAALPQQGPASGSPEWFKNYIYEGGADDAMATQRGLDYITQQGMRPQDAANLWNSALGTKFNVSDYFRETGSQPLFFNFGDPESWVTGSQAINDPTSGMIKSSGAYFQRGNEAVVSDELFWNPNSPTGQALQQRVTDARAQGQRPGVVITPYAVFQGKATNEQLLDEIRNSGADFVALDPYLGWGVPADQLYEWTKNFISQVNALGKEVKLVTQGFAKKGEEDAARAYNQQLLNLPGISEFVNFGLEDWFPEGSEDAKKLFAADSEWTTLGNDYGQPQKRTIGKTNEEQTRVAERPVRTPQSQFAPELEVAAGGAIESPQKEDTADLGSPQGVLPAGTTAPLGTNPFNQNTFGNAASTGTAAPIGSKPMGALAGSVAQAAPTTPQAALQQALAQNPNFANELINQLVQEQGAAEGSGPRQTGQFQFGDYAIRPVGWQAIYPEEGVPYSPSNLQYNVSGYELYKSGKTPEGKPLEFFSLTDDKGNITGTTVRYYTGSDSGVEFQVDAQGNQLGSPKGFDFSESWKADIAPLVSMAAMAFAGPLAETLSATLGGGAATFASNVASNAIVRGGLAAAQAALTGQDPLKAGLTGAATGAIAAGGATLANDAASSVLKATGSQIAADAVRGAVQSGLNAVPNAVVSGNLTGLGQAALTGAFTSGVGSAASQALAGTGITSQQISSGLTLAQQLRSDKPNISAIANAAAGLINSPNATVAAKAISLMDTISKAGANPAAFMGIMDAANQLSQAVNIAQGKGSDPAAAAYAAAKRAGATDAEAAAAARQITGGDAIDQATARATGLPITYGAIPDIHIFDESYGDLSAAQKEAAQRSTLKVDASEANTPEEAASLAKSKGYGIFSFGGKTYTLGASVQDVLAAASGKSDLVITNQQANTPEEAAALAQSQGASSFTFGGTKYDLNAQQEVRRLFNEYAQSKNKTIDQLSANEVNSFFDKINPYIVNDSFTVLKGASLQDVLSGNVSDKPMQITLDNGYYDDQGRYYVKIGGVGDGRAPEFVEAPDSAQGLLDWANSIEGTKGEAVRQALSTSFGMVGEQLADWGTSLANMKLADRYNALVKFGQKLEDIGQKLEIPGVTAATKNWVKGVEAETTYSGKLAAAIKGIYDNPLALVVGAKEVGQEIIPILTGLGVARFFGKAAGVATDVLMNAAESMGSQSRSSYQEEIDAGKPPKEAAAIADRKGWIAGGITAGFAGIADATMLKMYERVTDKVLGKGLSAAGREFRDESGEEFLISLATGDDLATAMTKSVLGGLVGAKASGTIQVTSDLKSDLASAFAAEGYTSTDGTFSPGSLVPTTGQAGAGANVAADTTSLTNVTSDGSSVNVTGDIVNATSPGGQTTNISVTNNDVTSGDLSNNVTTAVNNGSDAASVVSNVTNAAANTGADVNAATNAAVDAANNAGAQVTVTGDTVNSVQTNNDVTTNTTVNNTTGATDSTSVNNTNGNVTNSTTDGSQSTVTTSDPNTGVSTEVKADASTNVTTETTSDPNTNTTTVVATDATTNTTSNTVTDANTNVTTQVVTDANTNVTTEVTTDANTNVTTQVVTDANTGVNTNTQTDSNTNITTQIVTDSNAGTNTETTSNADTGVTTQVTTDTNTNTTTQVTTDSNTNVTTQVVTDANTGVNTETQTDANTNVTTQVVTDTNTNTTTQTVTDANTNITTQTVTTTDTTTETRTNNNTGVTTQTTTNTDTGTTTQITSNPNNGVTTSTTTDGTTEVTTSIDTNTGTQTTVVVDVNTGDIIDFREGVITQDIKLDPVKPIAPVDPLDPITPVNPVSPVTSTTSKTSTVKPKAPVTQPSGAAPGLMASMLPAAGVLPNLAPQFLKSFETQGYVDPFAAVKQAQAQFERDQTMQNIDPRLLAILQQRQQGSPLNQAEQEAANVPYFTYGQEDDISDILGGQASGFAKGGYVAPLMATGGMALPLLAKEGGLPTHKGGREDFKDGKHVAGEGDGQSDDIPAWLADGEFVFPADVVSALGNGSTKAGTDKLYEMMHSIRARARSKGPKDLPPPALKSPLDYLKSKK